jgi:hypothetical protein
LYESVAASCKGVGRFDTTARGVRLYHLFDCSLDVAYEGNGGMLVRLPASRWCAYTHHGIDEIVRSRLGTGLRVKRHHLSADGD